MFGAVKFTTKSANLNPYDESSDFVFSLFHYFCADFGFAFSIFYFTRNALSPRNIVGECYYHVKDAPNVMVKGNSTCPWPTDEGSGPIENSFWLNVTVIKLIDVDRIPSQCFGFTNITCETPFNQTPFFVCALVHSTEWGSCSHALTPLVGQRCGRDWCGQVRAVQAHCRL